MKKLTLLLLPLIFVLGCEKNTAPTCEITAPENNSEIEKGMTVTISADADDADGNLQEVRFYIDNAGVSSSSSFPYSYSWSTSDVTTGDHTIKATAIDEEGEESSDNISVTISTGSSNGNEPEANFTASSTSISVGSSVTFTDQSTNSPTSWSWDFGDGNTSTSQNPSHTYNNQGTYTVELTVTNNQGSDTETKTDYITVNIEIQNCGIVTDIDGNTYNTVQIGNQCWMAENLKVTQYPNGTNIPLVTDNTEWGNLADNGTDDAYCYYNNNASGEADTYGALYTWAAAMGDNAVSSNSNPSGVQGVCPDGWHLPSDSEWTELSDFLGGEIVAGGKMKETGTSHWASPNVGASNESGFTALPGGGRKFSNGSFGYLGTYARFWSATEDSSSSAWKRYLYYDYAGLYRGNYNKSYGFSVRCLKD